MTPTALSSRIRLAFRDDDPSAPLTIIVGGALLLALAASILKLTWLPQLVVFVSAIVAIAYFTRPEISLVLFFALRAIFDLLWWVPVKIAGLNVMELFSGAVAGLAAVLVFLELKRMERHPALPALAPYAAVMAIASARYLDPRTGMEIFARYLSPFLIMLLVSVFFDTPRKRRRLFAIIAIVCAVPVVSSLYHLASGQASSYLLDGYHRLQGGYKNLHNHALMMMFIASLGLFWLTQLRRKALIGLAALYTAGALVCLYFTYVRTAMLGLAACVGTYLLVTRRYRALGVAGAGAVLLLLGSDTLQDRFSDVIQLFTLDDRDVARNKLGSGRWALWTVSMSEFSKRPLPDLLGGVGLGQHRELTRPLFSATAAMTSKLMDPHNDYLSLMYQMGPVALIAYLAAQVQVLRYGLYLAWRSPDPWVREFAAFVVAVDATAAVTNSLSNAFVSRTTLGWYFWGLAGLLYACYRHHARGVAEGSIVERPLPLGDRLVRAFASIMPER